MGPITLGTAVVQWDAETIRYASEVAEGGRAALGRERKRRNIKVKLT